MSSADVEKARHQLNTISKRTMAFGARGSRSGFKNSFRMLRPPV